MDLADLFTRSTAETGIEMKLLPWHWRSHQER
jgi:hypothetical protein